MKLRSVKLRNDDLLVVCRVQCDSSMKLRSVKLRNHVRRADNEHAVVSSMKLRSVKLRNQSLLGHTYKVVMPPQ